MNYLRERLQQYGARTLSTVELLSLVLFSHGGNESYLQQLETLLTTTGGLQALLQVDFGQLCKEYGLSPVKAAQLQAVLELARRLTVPSLTQRYQITCANDIARLMQPEMALLDHEEMRVLVLNSKNSVVANLLLYQGTVDSAVLRVAEVFRPAITRKLPKIIVCHNHPSGNVRPSDDDIGFTQRCIEAGKLLDIELVDHLIVGGNSFFSLKEQMRW